MSTFPPVLPLYDAQIDALEAEGEWHMSTFVLDVL